MNRVNQESSDSQSQSAVSDAPPGMVKVRRAIISVSDKSGLVDFARGLQAIGVEIISTGGTMTALKKAGVQVVPVSSFTGSPEILDGRVKTLHPKVHAGILFRRDNQEHVAEMSAHEFKPIDMVVVNLYPFEKTVANPDATREDIIENIDIGGPSMIRSAAKNFASVAVLTSCEQYDEALAELQKHDGCLSLATREKFARAAFTRTSEYDKFIADYFSGAIQAGDNETSAQSSSFPDHLTLEFRARQDLRYGENPHQEARFYQSIPGVDSSLANAEVLAGKALSYNNIADMDAALEMTLDFERPFACILKHANPCGAAESDTLADAYEKALATDPLSAFGSIIGLNRVVDLATAQKLNDTQFIECILAPGYEPEALELLKKKKARRIVALPSISDGRGAGEMTGKLLRGGLLRQTVDDKVVTAGDLEAVTKKAPTEEQIRTLLFAWRVVKHTKSNAIVIAKDCATVGIGMGQTSRVDSSFMAVKRAGERAQGACLASDAFFPMPDGLEVAAEAGVTAFIQPGGSKKDPDVIAAADRAGVAMVFTGVRCFKH